MKYAVIKDDKVINVIVWDGKAKFVYPDPHDELIQSDKLAIGMIKDGDKWIMPEVQEPQNTKDNETNIF